MTRVDRRLVVYPFVAASLVATLLGIIIGSDEVRKTAISAIIDAGLIVAITALAGKHGQPIWDGLGKKFGKEKPE